MALKVVNTESLDAVANAINAKSGTSGAIQFPEGFVEAVENISAGVGENKLPSVADGTVTEITATDLAGVAEIRDYAFYNCHNVSALTMPSTITKVGQYAFRYCGDTGTGFPVTISENCERLLQYSFADSGAKELTIAPNMTANSFLANYCFYNARKLTKAYLGARNTAVGSYMFYGCSALTDVTIEEGYTAIGSNCFRSCSALSKISIPKSITKIDSYAFSNCGNLSFMDLRPFGSDVTFPTLYAKNSLEYVGGGAESGITAICVPQGRRTELASMTNWSNYADEIFEISIPDGNEPSATEGLQYGDAVCTGKGTATATDIIIGGENNGIPIVAVGRYAFQSDQTITSVTFLENVAIISDYAFDGCGSLESITFSEKMRSIGREAFEYNRSITSLHLPNSVVTVGDRAFYGCDELADVTLSKSLLAISAYMFSNCPKLSHITIPSSVTKIGISAFGYNYLLEYVDLTDYGADGVFPTLEVSAFSNCGKSTESGTFQIRVPSGRKAELSAMANWSTYADNIVEV